MLAQVVFSSTSDLEVHLRIDALLLHAHQVLLYLTVRVVVQHCLWNFFRFSVVNGSFNSSIFNGSVSSVFFLFLQLLLRLFLQCVKRVNVFVNVLGKFVVHFWQLLFLNFVQLDFKDGFFTGQVLCMVFFREGYLNFNVFARLVANQLVFKSWDKGA